MTHPNTPSSLLGDLSPTTFLRDYWQKKPLLIRAAIPDFQGLLSPEALAGIACDTDAPSRLVRFDPQAHTPGQQWQVMHGPFDESTFASLPDRDWTLLVQDINHFLPEARTLLSYFDFIPKARLDDLMVSYAPAGGGVGPHVDSYDVFLLQGSGQRRWRISAQPNVEWLAGAPLRILANFESEQEWVLSPGDMLYLPPGVAHWGIAEDDACMTYSIGFRAPSAGELAIEFLDELRQSDWTEPLYQDPDLTLSSDASAIDAAMVQRVQQLLATLPWSAERLGPFLARYLSEPKSHVLFASRKPLSADKFKRQIIRRGIALDLQSQMLHWQNQFYLNGEPVPFTAPWLSVLANQARLSPQDCAAIHAPHVLHWLIENYHNGALDWAE